MRGGYTELTNVPDSIKANIFKLRTFDICPNIIGQLTVLYLYLIIVRSTC